MDFANYLKKSKTLIDQQVEKALEGFGKEYQHPVLKPLFKEFKNASKGGKRVRGALVKLGFDLFSKVNSEEILKVSAAIEIFQTSILSHDDIIDKSLTRRGKPSLYNVLGNNHLGVSRAIVLGDLGFFISFQILAQTKFPENIKVEALKIFSNLTLKTGVGELLDIELPKIKSIKEEEILQIMIYKTAWYTFIGPLTLGAVLAGASKKDLKNLEKFGLFLGIAFQLQDDILGVFGDEKDLGKSVTSDITDGKLTLLYSYALENSTQKQSQILKKYYGKGKVTKKQIDLIKDVFAKTGALDNSLEQALDYSRNAKKIIPDLTNVPKMVKILEDLSDYIIERNK